MELEVPVSRRAEHLAGDRLCSRSPHKDMVTAESHVWQTCPYPHVTAPVPAIMLSHNQLVDYSN